MSGELDGTGMFPHFTPSSSAVVSVITRPSSDMESTSVVAVSSPNISFYQKGGSRSWLHPKINLNY